MRFITISLLVGLLSGCTQFLPYEVVSIMATDKGLIDHAVSYGSGKNCSVVRKNQGLSYCVEDEKIVEAKVHCYRTLGSVNCYEVEDPFNDNQIQLGNNNHNVPD